MSGDIEILFKTIKFQPIINSLKKIISIKKQCGNFQPVVAIIENADALNKRLTGGTTVLSLPFFKTVAEHVGILTQYVSLPEECDDFQFKDAVRKLNADPNVHGIIVNAQTLCDEIIPTKDISGLNYQNFKNIRHGTEYEILPSTAAAILEIITEKGIQLENTNILVLEDGCFTVPICRMLLHSKAIVTVHTNMIFIPEEVSSADIVIYGRCKHPVKKFAKPNTLLIECSPAKGVLGSEEDDSNPLYVSSENFLKLVAVFAARNALISGYKSFNFRWELTHVPLNFGSPGLSDIKIARNQILKNITTLAQEIGLLPHEVELYGEKKAKVTLSVLERCKFRSPGKYVVVSGITPTPLGEGKSTTTIGLCQALAVESQKNAIACLRQPSQGPTFGVKGGAAGGGYSQVVPMEDFNLHLTGDIHAVSAANNLVSAQIDARIFHEATQSDQDLYRRLVKSENGKKFFSPIQISRLERLGIHKTDPDTLTKHEIKKFVRLAIDANTITWNRVVDINDRFLREITIGQSPTEKGMFRQTRFDIAVASEIMAVLALTSDMADMKEKLAKMVFANDRKGKPLIVDDLGITGALAVLLKDALLPNLMQTLEGAPVFVHTGPFANIAHGNSSIIADKMALKLVGEDGFVVTEAGFGADIGLEKFCNIKCRYSGLVPNVVVIVATVRALKLHGGGINITPGMTLPKQYTEENIPLLEKGFCNLAKHIQTAKKFGLPVVVALNRFFTDTEAELNAVKELAEKDGAFACVVCNHFFEGSKGAKELAKAVIAASEQKTEFKFLYDLKLPVKEKIEIIAKEVYGADGVEYGEDADYRIQLLEKQGFGDLPICMAKTPLSLSHDPTRKGVPIDFSVPVEDIKLSAGAGFICPILGSISTMPGLPTRPAFYDIDIDPFTGEIEGLF